MTTKDEVPLLQTISEILVRRGLATSSKEAERMIRDRKIGAPQSGGVVIDPKAKYRFNEPITLLVGEFSTERTMSGKLSSGKRHQISRREFERLAASAARLLTFDPSKKPADRPAKKDRKAAISSTTHSRVLEADGEHDAAAERHRAFNELWASRSNFERVSQKDLELRLFHQEELAEVDERIAVALSQGAAVEDGVHTAELTPMRDEDGIVYLKLVVRRRS